LKALSRVGNPEVSVLMSCYNANRWLREAIESILAQTLASFELILVDDGSTDETANIIQHYREQDRRIIALFKKNTGLTDSLNLGVGRARGKWIARQDADDVCERTRLEEQVAFARSHPDVVLLGAACQEVNEHGFVVKRHSYPSDHDHLVQHLKRMQRFFPHSSAVFRRDTLQAAGCYNAFFRKSQDWDLWLRLSERGKVACLPRCLVSVRRHPEQITNSVADKPQLVYGTAASVCRYLRVLGHFDPSACSDETVWREFITWVEKRMTEEGLVLRYKWWNEERIKHLDAGRRLSGNLHLGIRLLRSDHRALLWEKLFGSSLPKRLAKKWIRSSCAL